MSSGACDWPSLPQPNPTFMAYPASTAVHMCCHGCRPCALVHWGSRPSLAPRACARRCLRGDKVDVDISPKNPWTMAAAHSSPAVTGGRHGRDQYNAWDHIEAHPEALSMNQRQRHSCDASSDNVGWHTIGRSVIKSTVGHADKATGSAFQFVHASARGAAGGRHCPGRRPSVCGQAWRRRRPRPPTVGGGAPPMGRQLWWPGAPARGGRSNATGRRRRGQRAGRGSGGWPHGWRRRQRQRQRQRRRWRQRRCLLRGHPRRRRWPRRFHRRRRFGRRQHRQRRLDVGRRPERVAAGAAPRVGARGGPTGGASWQVVATRRARDTRHGPWVGRRTRGTARAWRPPPSSRARLATRAWPPRPPPCAPPPLPPSTASTLPSGRAPRPSTATAGARARPAPQLPPRERTRGNPRAANGGHPQPAARRSR